MQTFVMMNLFNASPVRLITTTSLTDKIEVGIGVFFILELDEWVYDLFIEPLMIFDESLWSVYFQTYGTLQQGHNTTLRGILWFVAYYLAMTFYTMWQFCYRCT